MNRNKLLLFVFFVLVLAILYLLMSSFSGGKQAKPATEQPTETVTQSNDVVVLSDAQRDTYVNTIATINQSNKELEARIIALEAEKNNKAKNDDMVAKLVATTVDEKSKSMIEEYKAQLNNMIKTIPGLGDAKDKPAYNRSYANKNPVIPSASDIPTGLGLDSLLRPKGGKQSNSKSSKAANDSRAAYPSDGMVTISPFTQIAYTNDREDPVPVSITGEPIRKAEMKGKNKLVKSEEDVVIPFYTIPRNATLFNNTTMTALLGIVPNDEGTVLDPIRFKLITGPENLASNGHFIPGIRNIVWSGIATGNREMSCVRGEVHSVTFTFDDGRIYTQSSTRSGSTQTDNVRQILGYISDTRGKPCLTGQLITNAQDYLKDRMIASAVGNTAGAYAKTQEKTVSDANGTQTYFDGNEDKYILGQTLQGSLFELQDYLRQRARNAIDLVYMPSGKDVVLHVESEITIDYLTNGRKLDYANQIPNQIPSTTAVRRFD